MTKYHQKDQLLRNLEGRKEKAEGQRTIEENLEQIRKRLNALEKLETQLSSRQDKNSLTVEGTSSDKERIFAP